MTSSDGLAEVLGWFDGRRGRLAPEPGRVAKSGKGAKSGQGAKSGLFRAKPFAACTGVISVRLRAGVVSVGVRGGVFPVRVQFDVSKVLSWEAEREDQPGKPEELLMLVVETRSGGFRLSAMATVEAAAAAMALAA